MYKENLKVGTLNVLCIPDTVVKTPQGLVWIMKTAGFNNSLDKTENCAAMRVEVSKKTLELLRLKKVYIDKDVPLECSFIVYGRIVPLPEVQQSTLYNVIELVNAKPISPALIKCCQGAAKHYSRYDTYRKADRNRVIKQNENQTTDNNSTNDN